MSNSCSEPLIPADEPLTETRIRRRRREPHVVAELQMLKVTPAIVALTKLEELSAETLVTAYRACVRRCHRQAAEHIRRAMVRRIAPYLQSRLSRVPWRDNEERQDVEAELASVLYEQWQRLDGPAEFWEVRFWRCLSMRLVEVLRSVRHHRREVTGIDYGGSEHGETGTNGEDGTGGISPGRVAMAIAMDHLDPELRCVVVLKVRMGWTEEEIARHIGKSVRTVRNMFRRARRILCEQLGEGV